MKNKIKLLLVALVFVGSSTIFANYVLEASGDNDGWVDVPLMDTQRFESNCEYRVWDEQYTDYTIRITESDLLTSTTHGDRRMVAREVNYLQKGAFTSGDNIDKIEKRCKLPDTTPSGAIMLFKLPKCPDGWNKWLTPEDMDTEDMGTTDRRHIFCEKS
jgi:hypothetical protein